MKHSLKLEHKKKALKMKEALKAETLLKIAVFVLKLLLALIDLLR